MGWFSLSPLPRVNHSYITIAYITSMVAEIIVVMIVAVVVVVVVTAAETMVAVYSGGNAENSGNDGGSAW